MTFENLGTSSGAMGKISFDKPNRRAKGFLTSPVDDMDSLTYAINAQLLPLSPNYDDITRITARVLTAGDLTPNDVMTSLDGRVSSPIRLQVDAVIPLPLKAPVNSIVYLGGNRDDRIQSQQVIEEDLRFIHEAQRLSQKEEPHPLPKDYTQHISINGQNIDENDLEQVLKIYQSVFQDYVVRLDKDTIKEMFINNVVGLVRDKTGKIVSLTVAEIIPSIIDNMNLVELTDSATDPKLKEEDPEAKNINFWARQVLIDYLRENSSGITVLYSEARADLIPVLRNNFWQGFEFAGLLPNSCRMKSNITSSSLNRGEYGDLVVMYLINNKDEEDPMITMAPGIGEAGKIVISNHDTRAVLVLDTIVDKGVLNQAAVSLSNLPPGINRQILKAISKEPMRIGERLDGSPLKVEASIAFPNPSVSDQSLYWIVAGENTGTRVADESQMTNLRERVHQVAVDQKFETQRGEDLLNFAQNKFSRELRFITISPYNFSFYKRSLKEVYGEAFKSYPYNVVEAIKNSCGTNIYVAVVDGTNDRILAITGAEMMNLAGMQLAEIGDSASLKEAQGMGLGPLIKRYLLQVMHQTNNVPLLSFTDSRIANDAAVLKANRRAGFQLNPEILLPNHTEISSDRDPGLTTRLIGSDGTIFQTEHMTMTYITGEKVTQTLQQYGGIPL
ncbi:MAG: hypothetical protein UR68_C0001G0035 [Candidatus Roizmanbacteria bacterium GW2011_GWA2_35_19]|uniref:Uncharacterized protein n=2 Tax=Candidatus Roizmaniibacteriota TaxID=1752723 RepID=A0A0G0EGU7_9BACT|nr:MAG: hypothetical protein UR63_C0001G0035 [Candidatus Roizmanbacteria bacterium GW2011_GWC2_35_12]KKP74435.1 MAG: hypothetical protein UR68_C0001G0035 [Candidatus Roizmanbacteria bacterium GW2011_GWA2_35_19]